MATRHEPAAPQVRTFRTEDLRRLLEPPEPPCVSIYLPTHRRFPEKRQDPTRYRALLSRAESALAGRSATGDVDRLLGPLRGLEQCAHWEHSLDGLAVFSSGEFQAAYRLPVPVPEGAFVADSFHVKPLIPFLHANQRYFALALSQNAVSLYEGGPLGAAQVELRGVPASLRAALGVPDFDRSVTGHPGGPAGLVLYGRGPGREVTKESLVKFFRQIDHGLHEYLREERAPLILAAVGYYHPLYREVNTYPHLLEPGLDGNFERENGDGIHAGAWPIVSQALGREIAERTERYRELAGTGLASDRIDEIADAIPAGRVRVMLAAAGDRYETEQVDDLCEEALKRHAEVFVIPPDAMPTSSPVAAIYRY